MSGFVANPGVNITTGQTPEIAKRLDALAQKLGVTIHAISGYRTPSHSVAVGGFANDPHTKGEAIDIGVNGNLRASASQLSDAELASVGLKRPFPGAAEINHIQLADGSAAAPSAADLQKQAEGAVGNVTGAVTGAVGDAASSVAGGIVSAVAGALGQEGARILLWLVFVAGGAALAVVGIGRLSGLKPTELATKAAGVAAAVPK